MSNRHTFTTLRAATSPVNSFTKLQVTFLRSQLARILPELPRNGTTTKDSVAKRLHQTVKDTVQSWKKDGTVRPSWEIQQAIKGIKRVTDRNVETLYAGLPVTLTGAKKWRDYFGFGVTLPAKRITPGKLPRFSESDPTTTRDAIINSDKNNTAIRNLIQDVMSKIDMLTAKVDELAEDVTDMNTIIENIEDQLEESTLMGNPPETPGTPFMPTAPSPRTPSGPNMPLGGPGNTTTPTITFGTPGNTQSWPLTSDGTEQFTMTIPEGINANFLRQPTSQSSDTSRTPARIEITSRQVDSEFGQTSGTGETQVS